MDSERKSKLGTKWTCFSCGARFYDLNKPEPVCPKCSADQRESPTLEKPKRTRKRARKAPPPAELPREIEEDQEIDLESDELAAEGIGLGLLEGDDEPQPAEAMDLER